jgi:hypothetical protein
MLGTMKKVLTLCRRVRWVPSILLYSLLCLKIGSTNGQGQVVGGSVTTLAIKGRSSAAIEWVSDSSSSIRLEVRALSVDAMML